MGARRFIRARAAAGDVALGQRFLDAIQPFVWRRSLDFGVIDEVRQISARIRDHFAQGAQHRTRLRFEARPRRHPRGRVLRPDPADDPWRPGSARARAGDSRRHRCACRRGPARPEHARRACRRLSPAAHHRAPGADGRGRADPYGPGRPDGAGQCSAPPWAQDGAALLDLLRPHVERAGRLFDGLAPDTSARLSNDPDILLANCDDSVSPTVEAARRICRLAVGARPDRCARRPRRSVRGDAPGLLHAIAAERRPGACAQPPERHRRAAVERHEPLPAARGAAQAGAAAGQAPRPCAGARPTSWRGGRSCSRVCSTRRASDAAAGRGIRAPRRGDAWPALRCRARPRAAAGERAPFRARGPAHRPAQRSARSHGRLCAGRGRRAAGAGASRGARVRAASRQDSPAASW